MLKKLSEKILPSGKNNGEREWASLTHVSAVFSYSSVDLIGKALGFCTDPERHVIVFQDPGLLSLPHIRVTIKILPQENPQITGTLLLPAPGK